MTFYPLSMSRLDVGIWGFGREGKSVLRVSQKAGARSVTVVDESSSFANSELTSEGSVRFYDRSGLHHLLTCDVVYVSPGVPWRHPFFSELRSAGARISSAADLFLSVESARTIGVTGTKGKSTTASFIAHVLSSINIEAAVAGNIGIPLVDLEVNDDRIIVAELSSQQLALITHSPRTAVVTNLYDEHLDWHGSSDAYIRAKSRIFTMGAESLICENAAFERLKDLGISPRPQLVTDRATIPDWPETRFIDEASPMRHPHNLANAKLAVLAVQAHIGWKLSEADIRRALDSFRTLPHRLEVVRNGVAGKRWIDDSLSTTCESIIAAVEAMPADAHIALIVGGMDRGLDYSGLDAYLLEGSRHVTLIQIPSNGFSIGQRYARMHKTHAIAAEDLRAAVGRAASLPEVDIVLLSPGAPSYDFFANYEAKSRAYVAYIDQLT